MNVKFFIDRPVFASVISIFIVLAGIIGSFSLPVEQYPDIAPPTIMVMTSYPGADAEAVQKSVIVPLEQAINGVEDMMYITSSASNTGSVDITIYFKQGTDPDMAAVNVQNRVARATGLLPAEVNQIGVQTIKRQTNILQAVSFYSPNGTYDKNFLANYVKINIEPEILRIQGVGSVMAFGADYSLRIWLKPELMKKYGLIPSDITQVLAEQNLEIGTGQLGENYTNQHQYTLRYTGRLERTDEFENIVIRSLNNGEVLRLKDVARIELGIQDYQYDSKTNGAPGVGILAFQTAGSNATQVNEDISNFLEKAKKELPKDIEIATIMNSNDFLYASISEVVETLLIAIVLVILVVYFFLQDFRTTLIPAVAILVSLVGTFAFLNVAGFSINLLTLFALILVIGTVVDDAIVVVEAVQANFDAGYKSPYKASVDAMKSLVSPIFTTSIVFMAVFIPVTFISGTQGTFYTQFGITMAVAVALSTLNALTLSPALCALVLKPNPTDREGKKTMASRMRTAYNASFNRLLDKYKNAVLFIIHKSWLVGALLILSLVGLFYFMKTTPTGFVPDEDTGTLMVNVSTPPGTSLDATKKVMAQIDQVLKHVPEIEEYLHVAGYSFVGGASSTSGMYILHLKNWEERQEKQNSSKAVLGRLYGMTAGIKDASIFIMAPGMIPGYGTGNGFELHLQDKTGGDIGAFFQVMQQFMGKLNARPEIQMAFSTFDPRYPQYEVSVDAAQCKRAGISPASVLSTLGGYFGGIYASNFNRFTKVYRVMVQADPKYRKSAEDLNQIFVRNGTEMAPISQFVKLKKVYGPQVLNRFNLYNSIAINGTMTPGFSSGDGIKAIEEVAKEVLPRGFGYEFGGITREESQTTNTTVFVFVMCIIFVYLILAALYESFFIPFAVMLSVPFGLAGSFLFARIMGLENNIYLQTGLIMLIGLLAKTAILLTEYATERRKAGMTLSQAAYTAAGVRLRPILMTALTMVFGMLPLMFASGVGANGNSSLGTGVVGGMLIGTIALLFMVPSLFIFFQRLHERFRTDYRGKENNDNVLITQELEKIEEKYSDKNDNK
jgi:hydrophobe/amphiphile efflux-1 (HAE1) family protein